MTLQLKWPLLSKIGLYKHFTLVFMKIAFRSYTLSLKDLPQSGQHILAHQQNDELIVYQAYKPGIAAFAVDNQYLGGPDYSYNRMSWIKPMSSMRSASSSTRISSCDTSMVFCCM